jgi:hypothetical protein
VGHVDLVVLTDLGCRHPDQVAGMHRVDEIGDDLDDLGIMDVGDELIRLFEASSAGRCWNLAG